MKPTRKQQPYRRAPRRPSAVFRNIRRGATLQGYNPADVRRMAQKLARRRRASGR